MRLVDWEGQNQTEIGTQRRFSQESLDDQSSAAIYLLESSDLLDPRP